MPNRNQIQRESLKLFVCRLRVAVHDCIVGNVSLYARAAPPHATAKVCLIPVEIGI